MASICWLIAAICFGSLHLHPERADLALVADRLLEVLHREEDRRGLHRMDIRAADGQLGIERKDLALEGDAVADLPVEALHQLLADERAAAVGLKCGELLRVDFVVVEDGRHLVDVDGEVGEEVRLLLVVRADPLQLGGVDDARDLRGFSASCAYGSRLASEIADCTTRRLAPSPALEKFSKLSRMASSVATKKKMTASSSMVRMARSLLRKRLRRISFANFMRWPPFPRRTRLRRAVPFRGAASASRAAPLSDRA